MSSLLIKSWKKVFNLRPCGTSSEKESSDKCDDESPAPNRPPSYRSIITGEQAAGYGEFATDQVDSSVCGTQHPRSSVRDISIDKIDHSTGSERVLYLCAHASMTWDQFRREIVDIFPSYKGTSSAPTVLTVSYARDCGLSIQDTVVRHYYGSHCQSWPGEWHTTPKPVPHGNISFQMQEKNQILWYSPWNIAIHEVWCKEEGSVVKGRGPVLEISSKPGAPGSKTSGSTAESSEGKRSSLVSKKRASIEENLPLLAERLTSLEIYLCPHVNFFSPVMKSTLIFLLATEFIGAKHNSISPSCSECGARFNIYVQQQKSPTRLTEDLVIISARNIGTGASATEREWLNATEIRRK